MPRGGFLSKDLIVYLKTTDTCQLNCDHCFTNGQNGKKGWFDVPKTIDFFQRLKKYQPHYDQGHFALHGGEPMLCPPELLFEAWHGIKDLWPKLWWTVQTNLTYSLTDDKLKVFDQICNKVIGTSWDYGIRWKSPKQKELWAKNVKQLTSTGHKVTVMVSLNKKLIQEKEPIDIINECAELGIQYINFERITNAGNASLNSSVFPSNKELDAWIMKMWHQTQEHRTWEYISNMFLDSIFTSLVYNTHSGCRSRQCEQKILTINADGTVGGCPNEATHKHYGRIDDTIEKLMYSPCRLCNIQSEAVRNDVCNTCPVYDICNGDCHQLAWQDDVCAAPRSLMVHLRERNDQTLYKEIMNGFMGQE